MVGQDEVQLEDKGIISFSLLHLAMHIDVGSSLARCQRSDVLLCDTVAGDELGIDIDELANPIQAALVGLINTL